MTKRFWNDHGIRLDAKIQLYRSAILSPLLYGGENWTPYRRHIQKLDSFHMKCLRRILNVKWQDKMPNTDVLERCKITGSESMLMRLQLRWCGHVYCMPDCRTPKQLLHGQLTDSTRSQGVVVVVVVEMNIIKVALSHFCCRTTVQSDSVSVARQVTVRRR